ncbi:hypothetical protein ES707_16664 [subsurface metagenome]
MFIPVAGQPEHLATGGGGGFRAATRCIRYYHALHIEKGRGVTGGTGGQHLSCLCSHYGGATSGRDIELPAVAGNSYRGRRGGNGFHQTEAGQPG